MLHWLSDFWRKLARWVHKEQLPPAYHRSNLHGRRR
jgi:hypothetical protein